MPCVKTFVFAIAAISLAVTSPVAAAEKSGRSIRVDYADLDLGKPKDARTLERRVARAVNRLCGTHAMADTMFEIEKIDKCRAEAMRSADPQIARVMAKTDSRWSSAMAEDE